MKIQSGSSSFLLFLGGSYWFGSFHGYPEFSGLSELNPYLNKRDEIGSGKNRILSDLKNINGV
ncbi:hypothetical protein M3175_08805 [Robertmurraya korlensis]|uniref:hypothetical protein n=1 Tax=Robertmurraya korlensis TaxID=519977 RepID=UPI002040EE61|nr:hypothetical protein [Robertmurraya korlensis]MCM3600828.1 hypothetical protein [Robertmurraya korlensis]